MCELLEDGIVQKGSALGPSFLTPSERGTLDDESVMELFYTEFLTCNENHFRFLIEGWQLAFPHLTERMTRLIHLHGIMGADSPIAHPSWQVTPPLSENPREKFFKIVGEYGLQERIASGSFGDVYRAKHLNLSRTVAIKILNDKILGASSQRNSLMEEASSLASIQHPNIVQVFEVGHDDDCEYLAMEYVSGGTLRQSMVQPRKVNDIVQLIKKIAEAIQCAHERGIVHCDLKPDNILLDALGNPKVSDFGLAQRLHLASSRDQQRVVAGTPAYMAPEQISGQVHRVGPKCDVYALGVILYELMTHRLPFAQTNPTELLNAIRNQVPTLPSKIDRYIPRDLETICMKCLLKEPDDRYESAEELAADLARFVDHHPIRARRPSSWERVFLFGKRNRKSLLYSTFLLSIASVLLIWLNIQRESLLEIQREVDDSRHRVAREVQRAREAEKAFQLSQIRAKEMVGRWGDFGQLPGDALGNSNISRQSMEEALDYFEEFLQRSSRDPQVGLDVARATIRVAVLHANLGMWKEAENELSRAEHLLSELPTHPDVDFERSFFMYQRGMFLERLERWEDAKRAYESAVQSLQLLLSLYPKNPQYGMAIASVWIRWGLLLQRDNQWIESKHLLLNAVEQQLLCFELRCGLRSSMDPVSEDTDVKNEEWIQRLIQRASILLGSIGEEDVNFWRYLAEINYLEDIASGFDGLGYALQGLERYSLAESAVRISWVMRTHAQQHCSEQLWRHHLVARSERHLGKLLMVLDKHVEALNLLEQAIQRMEVLVRESPDRIDYRIDWGQSLCEAARVFRIHGEGNRSVQAVKQAIAIQEELAAQNPGFSTLKIDLATSISILALTLHAMQDEAGAIQQYKRTLQVDPKQANACNNFAWLLCTAVDKSLRDPVLARSLALQAAHARPGLGTIWSTVTLTHCRNGDFEAASRSWEKIGSYTSAVDYYVKAMIELELGDLEKSIAAFELADEMRANQKQDFPALLNFREECRALIQGRLGQVTDLEVVYIAPR